MTDQTDCILTAKTVFGKHLTVLEHTAFVQRLTSSVPGARRLSLAPSFVTAAIPAETRTNLTANFVRRLSIGGDMWETVKHLKPEVIPMSFVRIGPEVRPVGVERLVLDDLLNVV